MLVFLDIFYTILHLALIGFNLFGWLFRSTKRLHLITLAITAASWFILGIWYGIGYCPITDWHWAVKEKLGEKNLPNSFIKYFADKILNRDIDSSVIDSITVSCLVIAIIASLWVNFFIKKKKTVTAENKR